jgi:hypothetical protein
MTTSGVAPGAFGRESASAPGAASGPTSQPDPAGTRLPQHGSMETLAPGQEVWGKTQPIRGPAPLSLLDHPP